MPIRTPKEEEAFKAAIQNLKNKDFYEPEIDEPNVPQPPSMTDKIKSFLSGALPQSVPQEAPVPTEQYGDQLKDVLQRTSVEEELRKAKLFNGGQQ